MVSRYDDRTIFRNIEEIYEKYFEDRGLKYIRHYNTAKLKHPTAAQIGKLRTVGHMWAIGDRYFKLAHRYYGDSKLWWVIAWYNQKPTESHVKVGDVIFIPLPIDKILNYFDV